MGNPHLKLFMMHNESANSYGLAVAKDEERAQALLASCVHVCWTPCGEADLSDGEAVLAMISYPGSMARMTPV